MLVFCAPTSVFQTKAHHSYQKHMTGPPPNDNGNAAAPNINGEDNCDTNSTSTNGEDISFDLTPKGNCSQI